MRITFLTLIALAAMLSANAQNLPSPKLIKSGPSMMVPFPTLAVEFQGKYFCNAGGDIWMSDGTDAGTKKLKDLNQTSYSIIYSMLVVGNKLYFTGDYGNGAELWVSDGTENGTQMVKEINTGFAKRGVINTYSDYTVVSLNNEVFFYGHDGTNGVELWKSDGTETGTKMVKHINQLPNASIIDTSFMPRMGLVSHLGKIFFSADDGVNGAELWVTDGTDAGTKMVKDIMPGNPAPGSNTGPEFMMPFNNKLVFMINETPTTAGMFITDGTEAGTSKITMKVHSDDWFDYAVLNNKLYFYGRNDQNLEPGLWVTDGTETGTSLVKEGEVSGSYLSAQKLTVSFLTALNNKLYFSSKPNGGGSGEMELWTSDGTPASTILLKDLTPYSVGISPYSSVVTQLTPFGGKLYFRARDTMRNEIWVTDGTDASTQKIVFQNSNIRINGVAARNQHERSPLTRIGNSLFFWNSYTTADSASLYKLDMFPDAISDVNKYENVHLYPNPATNTISIDVQHVSNVSICNMAGMQVMATNHTTINIVTLPAGLYTATVTFTDGARQVVKFVKQ